MCVTVSLKCPYYGLWKVHLFGFGSPQQQVDMHASSKTRSLSYNMHLLLPYLLNDSQTIHSTIVFPNPSFAWH